MIVAACDKPEAKPPTNIEKDDKSTADTDVVPKGKSGSGSSGETNTDVAKSADKTGDKSGDDGEDATPAAYSFAFGEASHKVAFTAGTYTQAVVETNKPTGDARAITYTSSEGKIATVNEAGVVTFVTQGTVTITATKLLEGEYPEATARYTLYITMKPANKQALADEITRAMTAHGNEVDLNYIDVSDITDMSWLFSDFRRIGYRLEAFNGDISKWDVSKVSDMLSMFSGATSFNQDISEWNVARVTNMASMFSGATSFNQDISDWTVSNVTRMDFMFQVATAFDQDISDWEVGQVTNMTSMFQGATSFKQNLDAWGYKNKLRCKS